jgi:hypothetical protein
VVEGVERAVRKREREWATKIGWPDWRSDTAVEIAVESMKGEEEGRGLRN